MLRDLVQEARELGWRGTAFRASWELRKRTGAFAYQEVEPARLAPSVSAGRWTSRLPKR